LINASSNLPSLGWSDRWSALFAEIDMAGALPGRVVRRDRGFALVGTGEELMLLPVPGRLGDVVTGDWVVVTADSIVAILPRQGALRRRGNDGAEQLLAANVDVVLLVCGIDRPVKPGRIQRGAVQAWDAGAAPTVVLNKADLGPTDALCAAVASENPGLDVIQVSTVTGIGIEQVRQVVAGRTAVLLGESGAGKSTLMNALVGRELAASAPVRAVDSKGRHTTTRRELHVVPGTGVLIDTPGIRAFGLAADEWAVASAFGDVEELAGSCRFSDCRHLTEPGCAVLAAVAAGTLSSKRLESYHRLEREVRSEMLRANVHERRRYERRFGRLVKEAVRMKRREDR
jgi:ribosome biogenesis GTPase